jgi:NADPH-dependent 2,4-dienoyl-CoA reductase/sulfur reductase-like enzyme/nitrite reductase/ring-hydroxylating ferredoxin subunit
MPFGWYSLPLPAGFPIPLFKEMNMADEKDWQKLTEEAKFAEGIPLAFPLGKSTVLGVRLDGVIHVCGGKCTHYGGSLEKGFLRGSIITCLSHGARFDVKNGRKEAAPALEHLKCYETKVENGDVYVRPAPRAPYPQRPDTANQTFLIIGAGAAGNAAAETLRQNGFSGQLTMISPEETLPYDRPNLSKEFLAGKAKPEWLPLRSQSFYDERRIQLKLGHKVIGIDIGTRTVTLDDGDRLPWNRLLLATGGIPRPLEIPGKEKEGVYLLRSRRDAEAIIQAAQRARSAVVIGASFIGLEVASALRQRDLEVRIVAPETLPLQRIFGERIGTWIRGFHEDHGVQFYLGQTVVEILGSGNVEAVRLKDGTVVAADLIVVGIGIKPALDYLTGTGLVKENGIPVDACLRTSVEGIYAAGDIAAVPYGLAGQRIRVEHWVVAERHGQHAALAMLGSAEPYKEIPFFWTRQFDRSLTYLGWANSFDRVAYRGQFGNEGFFAGFYRDGVLHAAASLRRNMDLFITGELLKAGIAIPFEQFSDDKTDLRSLLPDSY